MLVCYLVAATALFGVLPREGVAALAPTALAAGERGTGRAEDLARLQSVLEQKVVAQRLAELGFSAEEVRARLEALDDQRLHGVAQRLDGLVPAGQVEVLVAGLLVVGYVAVLVAFGVGRVIYQLVAAIVRSSSAPETPTGEVTPPEGGVSQAPGTPAECEPGSFLYRCMRYLEEGDGEPGPKTPTGEDAPTEGEVEP